MGAYKKMILPTLEKGMKKEKGFALLIDPDKSDQEYLEKCVSLAVKAQAKFILVGGSLVFNHLGPVFQQLRQMTDLPLVLFPGSALQVSSEADSILFLSLISGRNPEYLIGNHVIAAPFVKKHKLEVIPTGYMLINGGQTTTVEYISQTMPIPDNKPDLAVATALAGEMLGHKLIYMDAGSGALRPIPKQIISAVSNAISVPLIVGGGIRSAAEALLAYEAGADIIVVGNRVEENPEFLTEVMEVTIQANL
ncbi:MAG: geranylgeranylglyceryl/heptaprenylglyceryl phosphate synthase [Bacteroidales bacterium]|nr:geranylgeranylglyceryl/heptaprenylglyceryl phosphate synthase [Bacteroidales bacterium]